MTKGPAKPGGRGRRLAVALAIWVVASLAYFVLAPRSPYGDGILILDYARQGVLASFHLLYQPALVGFTRVMGALGMEDRSAAFLFSAVSAGLALALLYLILARIQTDRRASRLILLLVFTTPLLFFFAATVEVHTFHLACVSLMFLLVLPLSERGGPLPAFLVGLIGLLAPLSHESGWLLYVFLAFLVWTRNGRLPLLKDVGPARALAFVPILVAPFAWMLSSHPIRIWLYRDVYGEPDAPVLDLVGIHLARIFERVPPPRLWFGWLAGTFFLPALGLWLAWLCLLPATRRTRGGIFWGALLTLALYLGFGLLFRWSEHGAYFIGFVPVAVISLAWGLPGRLEPRRALALEAVLALQVLILALGVGTTPDSQALALQAWSDEAGQVVAERRRSSADRVVFVVDDYFRRAHLSYDLRLETVLGPTLVPGPWVRPEGLGDEQAAKLLLEADRRLAALFVQQSRTALLFFTDHFRDRLAAGRPGLLAELEKGAEIQRVEREAFVAWLLQPHD